MGLMTVLGRGVGHRGVVAGREATRHNGPVDHGLVHGPSSQSDRCIGLRCLHLQALVVPLCSRWVVAVSGVTACKSDDAMTR